MQAEATLVKSRPTIQREQWAGYIYDFGNSAYASVVLLTVYSVYFKNVVVGQAAEGTHLWGVSIAVAMLVAAIISPILGAIADHSGAKTPAAHHSRPDPNDRMTLNFAAILGTVLFGLAQQALPIFTIVVAVTSVPTPICSACLHTDARRRNDAPLETLTGAVLSLDGTPLSELDSQLAGRMPPSGHPRA